MAGSQKVFLRIVGLVGDSDDPDEMPDRVSVSGRGRLIPTIATGTGDIAQGPDDLHEIRLIEPVPFDIVGGMLTYDAKPYVWLTVPSGEWSWRITFDEVIVQGLMRDLRDFTFPLDPATPEQIADEEYPGINLAQYGIGSWEPGTVNLTADAIQQITISLGRASNSALAAEGYANRAEDAVEYLDTQVEDARTARRGAEDARDDAREARGDTETLLQSTGEVRSEVRRIRDDEVLPARDAAQEAQANAEEARDLAEGHKQGAKEWLDGAIAFGFQFDQKLEDWEVSFQGWSDQVFVELEAELVKFEDIFTDMGNVANDVAIDAGRAEDAAGSAGTDANRAETAATGLEDARGQAEEFAGDAERSASAAADDRAQTGLDRAAAHDSAVAAGESAEDAEMSAGQASDDRVLAVDAAGVAQGHATAAGQDADRADAAAALAQSLRWVVRGAWEPGAYEAGDVVVWDERAYYAQEATSVSPPSQPWIPLTPAGGGGASHWDDLDGKPDVFPPTEHGHDAADVTGEATPLLDVTEASLTAMFEGQPYDMPVSELGGGLLELSMGMTGLFGQVAALESGKADVDHQHTISDTDGLQAALDETKDASRLEGALTDQVDASEAMVPDPSTDFTIQYPLGTFVQEMFTSLSGLFAALAGKADIGHTHDGADITGALTDQVDASAAIIVADVGEGPSPLPLGELGTAMGSLSQQLGSFAQQLFNKSNVGHTHTIGDTDGLQAALDNKVEAELVTEFPSSPTPGVLYLKAED